MDERYGGNGKAIGRNERKRTYDEAANSGIEGTIHQKR